MVALAVFYIAMKYDQPGLAYMGMLLLVIIALPKVFDYYSSTKSAIPPGDYLVLSKYKEQIGDYESAVKYLQKYIDTNTDEELNDELKKMITELKRKQLADTKPIEFESKRMMVPTQKSSEGGRSPWQSISEPKRKRIRIDRESEANHDLIRLLDKPGVSAYSVYKEISFFEQGVGSAMESNGD